MVLLDVIPSIILHRKARFHPALLTRVKTEEPEYYSCSGPKYADQPLRRNGIDEVLT